VAEAFINSTLAEGIDATHSAVGIRLRGDVGACRVRGGRRSVQQSNTQAFGKGLQTAVELAGVKVIRARLEAGVEGPKVVDESLLIDESSRDAVHVHNHLSLNWTDGSEEATSRVEAIGQSDFWIWLGWKELVRANFDCVWRSRVAREDVERCQPCRNVNLTSPVDGAD
jgi:hypothetical protein